MRLQTISLASLGFACLSALAAPAAHALNQDRHFQISVDSCLTANLPGAFCEKVGVETYNVDANEWSDPAAHAQMADGEVACEAADAVFRREYRLGMEIKNQILIVASDPSAEHDDILANLLGRALHTLQDNCAHAGMPNRQHAWWSMSDTCDGTQLSPDVQPAAIECARWATDEVLGIVGDALRDNGAEMALLDGVTPGTKHYPDYGDICKFLDSANDWNGEDRRWDNSIVQPALRLQLRNAIVSWTPTLTDVCADSEDGILTAGDEELDVSDGPAGCPKIATFCAVAADSPNGTDRPPYYDADFADAHGGCSVGPRGAAPSPALLLFLLAFYRRKW